MTTTSRTGGQGCLYSQAIVVADDLMHRSDTGADVVRDRSGGSRINQSVVNDQPFLGSSNVGGGANFFLNLCCSKMGKCPTDSCHESDLLSLPISFSHSHL